MLQVITMSTINSPAHHVPADGLDPGPLLRRRAAERRADAPRTELVQRVVSEFREMPCLRLTLPQAQRLFGLRQDVCVRIIDQLVRAGRLRHDPDGRYAVASFE